MFLLRKVSIISVIIVAVAFFDSAAIMPKHLEEGKANLDDLILPSAFLFLFVVPALAGIVASFFRTRALDHSFMCNN